MAQTEQLMKDEGVGELVVKTVRTLAKLSLQEQAMGAVVQHEAKQLRGRLKMKEGHKKSRVRLVKVNLSNGRLLSQEDIDQMKLEEEEKESKAVQKQLRAKAKKVTQGKKKLFIPKAWKQKNVSCASVESIEFHIWTDTGQLILFIELPLLTNFLDEEDQVGEPSSSTSRSGRTIRPSRRARESLDSVSKETQHTAAASSGMVTRSRRGKQ